MKKFGNYILESALPAHSVRSPLRASGRDSRRIRAELGKTSMAA